MQIPPIVNPSTTAPARPSLKTNQTSASKVLEHSNESDPNKDRYAHKHGEELARQAREREQEKQQQQEAKKEEDKPEKPTAGNAAEKDYAKKDGEPDDGLPHIDVRV